MIYFNGVKSKNYFEGWFFRVSQTDGNCALIPSISVSNGEKKAFVQVNLNGFSKKYEYDYNTFAANDREVILGGNRFSEEGIEFHAEDLDITMKFGAFEPLRDDIMGCFKFGTPCKHKIISMRHTVDGTAKIKDKNVVWQSAAGYAEKDWGGSFPKGYCWLQCNSFSEEPASFFFSAAKVGLPFPGLISVLRFRGTEYRFATYNFARVSKLRRGGIILKKGYDTLLIDFTESKPNALLAPTRGKMDVTIKEDLGGSLRLRLFEKDRLIAELNGINAGVEWVNL